MTAHERPGKGESVLIVDDDGAHAESTADCLRIAGYGVDVAKGGQEGLAALRAKQYDLLLQYRFIPGIAMLLLAGWAW